MENNTFIENKRNSPTTFTGEIEVIQDYAVDELVSFLKQSHKRFLNNSIPKIEQEFLRIIDSDKENQELSVLFNLFVKFQIHFNQHLQIEERSFFPYIETLYQATRVNNNLMPVLLIHYGKYSIKDFENTHVDGENDLTEIIFLVEKQRKKVQKVRQIEEEMEYFVNQLKNK